MKSTDGGASWSSQSAGLYTTTASMPSGSVHVLSPWPALGTYHLLDVDAVDANTIWASAAGPLSSPNPSIGADQLSATFVSTNGGGSWTRVPMRTNFQLWGISGIDGSSARAASTGGADHPDSDIFTISGIKNTALYPMTFNGLQDIQMVSATVGYAVGDHVFKTGDGVNWGPTSSPAGSFHALAFIDASTGWVVGDAGVILKTTNGGGSWQAQASGTSAQLLGVSFIDENTGWAVGTGGTLLVTTTGGSTWTAETSGTSQDLTDVKAISAIEAVAVGKAGTILRRHAQ